MHTGLSLSYDKTLMISIPKCGTYLLMNALDFLMDVNCQDWPKDQFTLDQDEIDHMSTPLFAGHILYNEKNKELIKKNHFTLFFIIRDPRDQCVSMMYWVRKHPMSMHIVKDMDNDTLLTTLITDHLAIYPEAVKSKYSELNSGRTITDFYNLFLPWMTHENICTIRFESLIGKRGSGSDSHQMTEINRILNHLDITKNPAFLKPIGHYLFGHSMTFRKGQIGSWKTHFTEHHKKLFKKIGGQLLIDLNYESGLDW